MRYFTKEECNQIIEYYKDHTDRSTCKFFHIGHFETLYRLLLENNISIHTKEESKVLKKEAYREGMLAKYGVINSGQLESSKKAISKANSSNKIERLAKYRQTCLDKYGYEYTLQVPSLREDYKKICLNKYGAEWYCQSDNFKGRKKFKIFEKDNIYFDSFPELCFYLYHKSLNHNIKRNPGRLFYYYDNKKHYCFPDFEINGQLYEIKGDHLYKKMQLENSIRQLPAAEESESIPNGKHGC